MSYNVLTTPPFDKQLKRLAKKYPSLKDEFAELNKEHIWVITAIKSAFLLPPKVKVNQAVEE